eukprot:CAMPEP_0172032762 /NCGR_PEP_ID=MMETSP1041-20130122/20060_1 /TAXON_ID=464988 /ORGANISM="Hemiselmis andersenii, Strain CCMP439" /LENGTH=34 /DNA_ID= /DNA_START= /DNA_END= /DNA_ORIENTATION=
MLIVSANATCDPNPSLPTGVLSLTGASSPAAVSS